MSRNALTRSKLQQRRRGQDEAPAPPANPLAVASVEALRDGTPTTTLTLAAPGEAPPAGDTLATATVVEWRADGRAVAENGWPLPASGGDAVTLAEDDVADVAVLVNAVEQAAYVSSHMRPRADGTLRALFVQVAASPGDVVTLVKGARTVARAALDAPAWWTVFDDTTRSRTAPTTRGFPSRVALPTPAMLRASKVLGPLATQAETLAALGAAHPVVTHDARWATYNAQHLQRTAPGFPGLDWVNGGDGQYVWPTLNDLRTNATADGHVPAIPSNIGDPAGDYAVWRQNYYVGGSGTLNLNFYDRVRLYLVQYAREVTGGSDLLRQALSLSWHHITQGQLPATIAGGPESPPAYQWQPEGVKLFYLLTGADCALDLLTRQSATAVTLVGVGAPAFNSAIGVGGNTTMDPRDQSRILGALRNAIECKVPSPDREATLLTCLGRQWQTGAGYSYREPVPGRAVMPFGDRTGQANFAPDELAVQGFMHPVLADEWLNLRRAIPDVIGATHAATILAEVPKLARYLLERASTAGVLMTYDGQSLPRRAYWNYWTGDPAPDKGGNWDLMRMIGSLFAVAWRITGESALADEALQIQADGGSRGAADLQDDWQTSHSKSFNESWFNWGLTTAMFVDGSEI